ncbi:MAG: hypothetical protein FD180_2307 [Planctomycetota bacterium]|nr:MAG: hypothetical protein FD180_2307 [Planctomycetota bacterium]
MRRFALACSLLLASAALAGEPRWVFKPGQTFTYECRSDFDWTVQVATAALTPDNGGGPANGGSAPPTSDGGGTSGGGGGGGC